MSGLVDIWTSEVDKLREKGQNFTLLSKGNASAASTLTPPASLDQASQEASPGRSFFNNLAANWQVKKLVAPHCSEATLSMLVNCFSP